jgi:hypothetical protein
MRGRSTRGARVRTGWQRPRPLGRQDQFGQVTLGDDLVPDPRAAQLRDLPGGVRRGARRLERLLQSLVSTVKLPLLFLVTLAICLPTLYLFNLVFGARLSVLQACALIMVALTVTAVLTFAFAPISLRPDQLVLPDHGQQLRVLQVA